MKPSENIITMATADRYTTHPHSELKKSVACFISTQNREKLFVSCFLASDWLSSPQVCMMSHVESRFSPQECVFAFRGAPQLSVLVQPPGESPDQSQLSSPPSCSQSQLSSSVSVPSDGRGVKRFGATGHRTLHLSRHSSWSEEFQSTTY